MATASPRIMLATICLNEMEWLPKLYQQHKAWPGLCEWVFVEGSDAKYKEANPDLVTDRGLSADGTTEHLVELVSLDHRVTVLRHGVSQHADPAQGKCALRNRYLEVADSLQPDFIVAIDADEFYSFDSQARHVSLFSDPIYGRYGGYCFSQREIWRPPTCPEAPLFSFEVIGGLWRMHHCKVWRWHKGMRHTTSHVWPSLPDGTMLNKNMCHFGTRTGTPQYIHLGWAANGQMRQAKTRYYHARGEGQGDGRLRWMQCREAWYNWQSKQRLPHGAKVIQYRGEIPECFR